MRHLSDGALRRLYDEPLALEEEARGHYRNCVECRSRFSAVSEDARYAAGLLAVPGATVDSEAALGRLKSAAPAGDRRDRRPVLTFLRGLGWRKPAGVGLVAAALAASVAFTPLAATVTQIFEPKQITPVPVNVSDNDLAGLKALSSWGDVTQAGTAQVKEAASADEARANAGGNDLPLIAPKSLPAAIGAVPVSYGSVGQVKGTVTFNDKAPVSLQKKTVTVQAGPAEAAFYGDLSKARSAGKDASSPQQAAQALGPTMVIVETHAPKVTSTGASIGDIKKALLAQPNLSKSVRDAINDIDSPSGNLPIPIPAEYAKSSKTTENGVTYTVVGDDTGLGAGVIFVKSGILYAVGGTIRTDEAMAVARSLPPK